MRSYSRQGLGLSPWGILPFLAFLFHTSVVIGGTVSYTYDDAGRVIQADYGDGQVIQYAYDNAGNLLEREAVAAAQEITLEPQSYDFGEVKVGSQSTPRLFKVTNVGDVDFQVGVISVTGEASADFTVQNDACTGQTLEPEGGCTLDVVFAPSVEGSRNAILNVPSADPEEEPTTATLSGTGGGSCFVSMALVFNERESPSSLPLR